MYTYGECEEKRKRMSDVFMYGTRMGDAHFVIFDGTSLMKHVGGTSGVTAHGFA